MSITPFKDKKLYDTYDSTREPQYGVLSLPVSKGLFQVVQTEVKRQLTQRLDYDKGHTVEKEGDNLRRVDVFRIYEEDDVIRPIIKDLTVQANSVFNYKISRIQDLQLLRYRQGDYYKVHSDVANGLASTRKISFTWLMNTNFEGGDMTIINSTDVYTVQKSTDVVTFFTPFFNHEVKEVVAGTRIAIVGWIAGDSWR